MDNRRTHERLILDESSTLNFRGAACFIVDFCTVGLGITFISTKEWPEKVALEYVLPRESGQKRHVLCRTVWESRMNFYKPGYSETVRRRGLEFIEPDSESADKLFRHLSSLAAENQ